MQLILRGMFKGENDPTTVRCEGDDLTKLFYEALRVRDFPVAEPVLTWDDGDTVAALDVDVPEGCHVSPHFVLSVAGFPDQPEYYWRTHGGGFRGIFFARAPLTAQERALLFAHIFVTSAYAPFSIFGEPRRLYVPSRRIEIKCDTRHPMYVRPRDGGRCGMVHPGYAADTVRLASMLIGDDESVTDEQIDEWLCGNGFEYGKRYDHKRCPIAPSDKGRGEPVVPLHHGIYCHYCKASGPRGFISYTELIDPEKRHRQRNPLKLCAKGKGHWGHARLVVEAITNETGPHAETLYRALLKTIHMKSNDPHADATKKLLDSVFYPPTPIVRGRGCWFHPDLSTPCSQNGLSEILASLPACRFINEKGEEKISQRTRGFLMQNGDLSDFGYPALLPIRGVDFGWKKQLDALKTRTPVEPMPCVRVVTPADPPFIERSESDLPAAEAYITQHFPGCRLDLLKLLIAGKGVAQLDPSEPPLVMIHGQSESAKTAHVMLAAELCADFMTKISIGQNEDEFLRAVAAGADVGAFVFLDEVSKHQAIDKILPERLLKVARGQNYRALYIGSRPMPPLPLIGMADTVVPDVIQTDVQLARRVVEVALGCGISAAGADWRVTCGMGDLRGWRAASEKNAWAADAFVSDVMRQYVSADFRVIAKWLGFATFRDAAGDFDNSADYLAFFIAACKAPDADTGHIRGRGYKVIEPESAREGPIERTYKALGEQGVAGAKWGDLLQVPGVELDFRHHGKKIYVRFRHGKNRASNMLVNGDVIPLIPGEVVARFAGAQSVSVGATPPVAASVAQTLNASVA